MKRLEVSGAVRPLKWPLGVKWLKIWGLQKDRKKSVLTNMSVIKGITSIVLQLAFLPET
jgi:hypothetical protein